MPTPAGTLSELATVFLLIRDQPDRKDDQRDAFKRFAAGLGDGDHVLKVSREALGWDGVNVPPGRGEIAVMQEHLLAHGIGEIRLPIGLMTSTFLSLVRALAAPPGTYGSFDHLVARLDAAGCGIVPVLPLPPAPPSAPADPGGPAATRPRVDDEGRITALGPGALTEAKVGMMHFATLQHHTITPSMEVMSKLEHATSEAATTEALNQLLAAGEMATRQAEWKELLRAAHGLVELERKSEEAGVHRSFAIGLRRLLPRSSLEHVARMVAHGNMKAEATAVLRRMGADGTEVLLTLLANSDDMNERRGYFNALKEMTEGSELLIHMLSHDQWFVARNMAELCGELQEERAVPALGKLVRHDDERVRRAAAGALAKIGGSGAMEPLRRALHDPVPAVRLQAVQGLDGRRNRGLAMSLAVAAEEESKHDVQKEMYIALGRIGSADALLALKKAIEPGGRVFNRKPTAVRLAAIHGLHAAGPAASNLLKELLEDQDAEVREAATRALQTIWE